MPFAVGCGFAGGGLREVCPKEAIWHLSPLFFIDLHRRAWRMIRFKLDWLMVLLAAPIGLELIRQALGSRFGDHLFYSAPPNIWVGALVVLATVLSVAIPIKIWNTARIEHRLQRTRRAAHGGPGRGLGQPDQPSFPLQHLDVHLVLDPLTAGNRTDVESSSSPDCSAACWAARNSSSHSRKSSASIDEYLDIETVRFGPTLTVEKDISPDSLELIMPSMLLQPLVENAIKHGIGTKVGGGRIIIRISRSNGLTVIEVADDGSGMLQSELDPQRWGGIGLRNVDERTACDLR